MSTQNIQSDICVIGAGPAGLTAAYTLSKTGHQITMLEADSCYVGGISRTVKRNGYCVDIGGHRFFSKSHEINSLWQEILNEDLLVRKRKSRIYYGNKFYPYPLSVIVTLRNLGISESILCVLSYFKALCFPVASPHTFEQWVSNYLAKDYSQFFLKPIRKKFGEYHVLRFLLIGRPSESTVYLYFQC